MARQIGKLTTRGIASLAPGRHSDGGGLFLQVTASGARSWTFLYRWGDKRKEMGLGGLAAVGLAAARAAAAEARAQVAAGIDPLAARREATGKAKGKPTFGTFADQLIEQIKGGFRNEKHRAQWSMTLGNAYCREIRQKRVDEITTEDILRILRPIWLRKAETASRLRGRLERVLDAAKAAGHRSGENPARWKGHLAAMLPARAKLQRGHHSALPYPQVVALVRRLRKTDAISARALEFLILTAARSAEVLGACWSEVDLEAKTWQVAADRMKAGRPHRVPLTTRAVEIVEEMATLRPAGDNGRAPVFPGRRPGRPLSAMALTMVMRHLDLGHFTVHGHRSAFRDWAGEETQHPREICEAALAHRVGDEAERAYRRGDSLEKRRRLMDDWEKYIEGRDVRDNVIPLPTRG